MESSLILFVVVLALVGVALYLLSRRSDLRRRKRLESREPMPDELFVSELGLGPSVGALAIQVRRRVAERLGVSPESVIPDDRFGVEFLPEKGWEYDDEVGVLMYELQEVAARQGVKLDLGHIETVRDYVRAFSRVERSSST